MVQALLAPLWHLPRNVANGMIRLYQGTLSPDHGPLRHLYPYGYCRHTPTCSAYAMEMLRKRGLVMGSLLSMRRLLTCHPWRKPDEAKMRELAEKVLSATT
ncbi:MAG: membrane protein insertion efficiency factor YidD [Candidatus Peribacteraceae bacterium]